MSPNDTIVAISSTVGPAARGIVRLSGSCAFELAATLTDLPREPGVRPARIRCLDHRIPGWIYSFLAPRSATGQDVVELHLPGNPVILRATLRTLIDAGARPAEPGEFTARAYFNGRIDLSQAEGVAATISAANELELRAARQLLSGQLSLRVKPILDALADCLALVEVGIDFSDEDVNFLPRDQLVGRVKAVAENLDQLVTESRRFVGIRHEPSIVLVGRPNAGKSTLLNALSGLQRAVVSPVAGTTRDLIWAHLPLRRGIVRLCDAAGIDQALPADEDVSPTATIARQMQLRSRLAVESADVVVIVQDHADPAEPIAVCREAHLRVRTKADLSIAVSAGEEFISVSALTGEGMELLRARLDDAAFGPTTRGSALALNDRHLAAIDEARSALSRLADPPANAEIVALELREALDALGAIVGQVTPDDVLGRVFGTFCIGK